jgi:hypothetical protein
MKFETFFMGSLCFFLITSVFHHYFPLNIFKILVNVEEMLFISLTFIFILKKMKNKFPPSFGLFFLFLIYIVFHMFFNIDTNFIDIIKIIGYFLVFYGGYYFNYSSTDDNKKLIYVVTLIPIIVFVIDQVVGFQGGTVRSMSIFVNSNNFIFYSICAFWLLLLKRVPVIFLYTFIILSFLFSSTLGAILAFILSVGFYFRNKIFKKKYITYFTIIFVVLGLLIGFSEIYIFQRIRGTYAVIYAMLSKFSISEFADVNFGQAMLMSGQQDGGSVSFLFRIKIWVEIVVAFFNSNIIDKLFGLGFGIVPKINSFGLVAHNDYLTWIIEGGLIGGSIIIFGLWSGIRKLYNSINIIPYLTILIYFSSENLYFNFYGMILFIYCLAYSLKLIKNENITN